MPTNTSIRVFNSSYPIWVGSAVLPELQELLREKYSGVSRFILVDENTREHCLPLVIEQVPLLREAIVIEIPAGETHKKLKTCHLVWQALLDGKADRHALLINLGGGVIGDLGGFVAATFKRGIDFLQMPTTLLAQVDASVGGKVGVDLGPHKNQVGVFANPVAVFVCPAFLDTLDQAQLHSGLAESIKHGLIADPLFWEMLQEQESPFGPARDRLIAHSLKIKNDVVLQDPLESGLRKILNFGHTIGHAVESYFLEQEQPILHGEAVALGMICEGFLSVKHSKLNQIDLDAYTAYTFRYFSPIHVPVNAEDRIVELMAFDKKNQGNSIRFVLLESIGKTVIDVECPEVSIREALQHYRQLAHQWTPSPTKKHDS